MRLTSIIAMALMASTAEGVLLDKKQEGNNKKPVVTIFKRPNSEMPQSNNDMKVDLTLGSDQINEQSKIRMLGLNLQTDQKNLNRNQRTLVNRHGYAVSLKIQDYRNSADTLVKLAGGVEPKAAKMLVGAFYLSQWSFCASFKWLRASPDEINQIRYHTVWSLFSCYCRPKSNYSLWCKNCWPKKAAIK